MKKYDLIIFDLDGTLMDTSMGIINCYNYTANLFGKNKIAPNKFKGIIGSPLSVGFKENYGIKEEDIELAIKQYRQRYSEQGIYEASLYDGVLDLLKKLKQNGFIIAVATLKLEKFAQIMLTEKKIMKYFDVVYGTNDRDSYTKSDLLNKILNKFKISKEKAILIGDSKYDAEGAKQVGIDFLGVSYGLGYDTVDAIKKNYYTYYSEDVLSIFDKLYKK